jgi:enoyl-CoA hydratase/carnithine racemase
MSIDVSMHGRVAVVTVNRPEVLNALSSELLEELLAAFRGLADDDDCGVAVLTGSGERAFIAGADIAELATKTPLMARTYSEHGQDLSHLLETMRKPTIAAVNGYALGGGCEMALACDLRFASTTARFGQPEINLGIIPGAGGTQRWPRTAGKYVAMEVMLTGAPLTAQRAYELGIVNKVVPAEATILVATRLAREIAAKPPLAVRMAKEAVLKAFEAPLSEGLASERKSFYFLFATEDQKEGMRAFLEKRKGVFKGR